jgi:CBS-domain-containing membrane protein
VTTVAPPSFLPLAGETGRAACVTDAMITCPKTHGLNAGLEEIRAFFDDDHVHMALIVAADGRLVTTIERSDLPADSSACRPVAEHGTLVGRTTDPAQALDAATASLLRERRRRLAVVDDSGRLLGMLCLKKNHTGYCSDENVRERADEYAQVDPEDGKEAHDSTTGIS